MPTSLSRNTRTERHFGMTTGTRTQPESFDPVTLEIFWSRLISIADEAAAGLLRTAFSTIVRLRSKVGLYCGEVVEISQPLLPMGMNTPSCTMDAP